MPVRQPASHSGVLTMMKFLRFGTRHHLMVMKRDSYGAKRGINLNPLGYCTTDILWDGFEPLWLYRLRHRIFSDAGAQRCGRRDDVFGVNLKDGPAPDRWNYRPDGNRTCSYCGSIHPDDLMAICRKIPTDDRYAVEPTDKSYKVYVRIPGVRNASEGAIKFYKQHAPAAPTEEEKQLFAEAIRISDRRYDEKMKARFKNTNYPFPAKAQA